MASSEAPVAPPAAVFAPLLTESLNGFAIWDSSGRYVYASASLCNLLTLSKDKLLGRDASELVFPADRAALRELLDEARRAAAEARRCESFVQLRHACGDTVAWQPVELKACTDGEFMYCVLLDARMPARLESVLPHFLLSTSHDLRTPCCSVQAATALLLSLPAVAADGEACSLLHTVDASCEALLRCVTNVLQMRQLQRAGSLLLQLPPARVFDPVVCLRRVVNMVAALDSVQPRLLWDADATARRLPPHVLGDEASVTACLQNVLLTAMLWLPRDAPVHLRVDVEAIAAPHVGMRVTMQPPTVGAAAADPQPDLIFVVTVETPGRALTAHEAAAILEPFSMLPADKGGGTGLALYVSHGLARAMGGKLQVQPGRHEGTVLRLLLPLRVPAGAAPPAFEAEAEGPTEAPPLPPSDVPSPRTAGEAQEGATDEVQLTSRMFECLLANSDDVFVHCRITTQGEDAILATIEYISPSVASRLGFSQRDAVGLDILSVCHPEDHCAFLAAVRAAHDGSGPHSHRLMYVHRNLTASGGTIWCHTSGMCAGDQLYLVCRDMRTIRSVELALRTFTLAMSHDMREPCNAILVAAAVLERRACVAAAAAEVPTLAAASGHGCMSPPLDARSLVACIRSACSLLLGIVGNVLTAPQVESGELTLQHNVFSPARLVEDVLQACRLGCAAAAVSLGGASIELEAAPAAGGEALPSMVESDRNRLAQVVQNLVTNACKFGRGAPVRVQASLQRAVAGQTSLQVTVRDTGRGMSPEEAAQCFVSEQAAPAAAGGGTGLGLYISSAFARLMGGTLKVQSELGKGSTFELCVPVRVLPPGEADAAVEAAIAAAVAETAAVEAAEESQRGRAASFAARAAATAARGGAQPAASPLSPRPSESQHRRRFHVLVADDYALNLRLITRLLQVHDFMVTAVTDGAAALDALLASFAAQPPDAAAGTQQQQPFDVVVLDMDMPLLRGPQVAAKFREWEAQARPQAMKLPIIALTANVLEEHATECANAGMDLFFSKPLREADVAVLRAHALAYAEQRALETLEATTLGAQHVVHAATARSHQAYHVLGLPVVASAVHRGSPRSSVSSQEEEHSPSPREHAADTEE